MNIPCKILLGSILSAAPVVQAADLDVTVADVRAARGTLMISIDGSTDAWDGKAKPVAAATRKAGGAQETFHFGTLPPGTYAVKVIHDENDNGKLDTNFMGMPTEGYGFSNDPKVMRKPTFDEAKFELGDGDVAITIHLR